MTSPFGPVAWRVHGEGPSRPGARFTFTCKEVKKAINNTNRGKSPAHDGLSIEHLQHAGPLLPRVLTLLFNSCLGHSYLPENLMQSIVEPIVKNGIGDIADRGNYRPSLASLWAHQATWRTVWLLSQPDNWECYTGFTARCQILPRLKNPHVRELWR